MGAGVRRVYRDRRLSKLVSGLGHDSNTAPNIQGTHRDTTNWTTYQRTSVQGLWFTSPKTENSKTTCNHLGPKAYTQELLKYIAGSGYIVPTSGFLGPRRSRTFKGVFRA